MKLVSTTLAGHGTAPIICDALRSVAEFVDECLVIWTGGDGQENSEERDLMNAARDAADIVTPRLDRPTLLWNRWLWQNDFAAARNAALAFADDSGADWSVMVDTDERVICPDPARVLAFLAALPRSVEVVVALSADGEYGRERFFRHPARHRWVGRTHEAFPVDHGEQATIPAEVVCWSELPKSVEQIAAKYERDIPLLKREVAEHPIDARWRLYLGASLAGSRRYEDAVEMYRSAAQLGRGEDQAMACARAAEILIHLGKHDEAIEACALGHCIRADFAELAYLAGVASLKANRPDQAAAWARIAEVHGTQGAGRKVLEQRVGFRLPRGLNHGPAEVLSAAMRALGDEDGADAVDARRTHVAPAHSVRMAPSMTPTDGVHITVTSTGRNCEPYVARCIRSVQEQTFRAVEHYYVDAASGDDTYQIAVEMLGKIHARLGCTADYAPRSVFENLLPIWRSLPDDEVIVWLDGDDWLASPDALRQVAQAHAAGALVTYGSFMLADGRPVITGGIGPDPRSEPWRLSHLKSFRAGLVKQIRDEDLRRPDGAYVDLAVDRAVMLPLAEMAAERCFWIPRILCVYNQAHSFERNADADGIARERAEVERIHRMPRYGRVEWPVSSAARAA